MRSRSGQPRSLRAAHRISACAVVLLWCAAPVLAAVHAAAESHRYCAQHDAVEEASDERDGGSPDQVAPLARSGGDQTSTHEDCSFAPFCRFGQLVGQLILDATGVLEPITVPPPSLPPLTPAVAVIVVAPKTSPPV
jgi:hypothetical protein